MDNIIYPQSLHHLIRKIASLLYVNHADRYYFGNNSMSSSGIKDIRFNKATVGNTGKGNNFSTIDVGVNAYFAIYNDLTLKFMVNETVGFENLDVKIINDGSIKYATSSYGGTDSKTNNNGSLSKSFEFKYHQYTGSSTPTINAIVGFGRNN